MIPTCSPTKGSPFPKQKPLKRAKPRPLGLPPQSSQSPATYTVRLEKPKIHLQELKIFNDPSSLQTRLTSSPTPSPTSLPSRLPELHNLLSLIHLENWAHDRRRGNLLPANKHLHPTKPDFLFTFPFIFLLFGCPVGFFLDDRWPKWCTRRNNGVCELEFRLILLVSVLFAGIPEIFGFGYYPSRADVRWIAVS
jgi:hypothetical protein